MVCPIPGTTNLDHLEDNLKANSINFTEEELKTLNSNENFKHVKGDRYPKGRPTFQNDKSSL